MFDRIKSAKAHHKEHKRIKSLPAVGSREYRRSHVLGPEKEADRRKVRRMLAIGGVAAVVLLGISRCGDDGDNPGSRSNDDPVGQEHNINIQSGRCELEQMTTEPEQTKTLQGYLDDHGYYEGEHDGVYDEDVVQAVMAFQADAKEQDRYNAVIDGQAGYLTCRAIGAEPFWVQD